MDESEVMQVDNLQCNVCDGYQFQQRDGFYYCLECGTQTQHVRLVDIDEEENFNETTKHGTTQRAVKKELPENEITSWEFYNYVLYGYVQELLNMGAKPELKLMALQIWSAYLGRMEVAFYKSNELGLPKLSVRALARDARIIYNYKKIKPKRVRKQKKSLETDDARTTLRKWRRTKRKLDKSGYASTKDINSEGSVHQSIKLQWSRAARKSFKNVMRLKHLDTHSQTTKRAVCRHNLTPNATSLDKFDRLVYSLSVNKMYVILAMALNLVGDSIQISDLLRFVEEERLTGRFILSYLPENVAANGKTLLKELDFNRQMDKTTNTHLRSQIGQLMRFIGLKGFVMPDLAALTERYVRELDLPHVLNRYVACLMDIMPPAFKKMEGQNSYPCYEARVMGYIIYALKLLFGLDDVKERDISASAIAMNAQLKQLYGEHSKQLFVYTEWMQFVELRKTLVGYYNESFARRFGVATQMGRKVNDMINKERKQKAEEYNYNEMRLTPAMQRMRENFCLIFEKLLKEKFGETNGEIRDEIEFQPSLTPAHSYFKRLLLHATQTSPTEMGVQIPEFMQVNHSERDLAPFKNSTEELSQLLAAKEQQLRIEELACRSDWKEMGIFKTFIKMNGFGSKIEYRANTDIDTETWLNELKHREKRCFFKFYSANANYGKHYLQTITERERRRHMLEISNPYWEIRPTPTYLLKLNDNLVPLNELHGVQLYDESNMDPLRVPLHEPRRHLEQQQPDLLKEESIPEDAEQQPVPSPAPENELTLKISNFDCWLLHGHLSATRQTDMRELNFVLPSSFRWLLDICAATICVKPKVIYEQLLVIETMFHHGIEDWNEYKKCLRVKYTYTNKNISNLARVYRDMW